MGYQAAAKVMGLFICPFGKGGGKLAGGRESYGLFICPFGKGGGRNLRVGVIILCGNLNFGILLLNE
jgi:hypothetical protein